MGRYTLKWIDSDSDAAQVSYEVGDTLGDGTNFTALQAINLALRDAILAVQLTPALVSQGYTASDTIFPVSIPTNGFNQSSIRWLIEYRVNGLNGLYSDPIPMANFELGTTVNGVNVLDLSAGVGAALKSAFEAAVVIQKGIDAGGTGAVTVERVYGERT